MSTTAVLEPIAAPAERAANRVKWLGFAVVTAASVMDLLDSTITQTAAPAIRRELGGSYADIEWMTAAYTLAMSAFLLLGSRLGDAFGRKRMLLAGIGAFTLASLLCAIAPSTPVLIAARTLQGATGALMLPQGFGLIRDMFGDEGQQQAFGVFGPVMGLAAVIGPLTGGGLVNLNVLDTGWRAIFLVNVPIGLAALYAGRQYLPAVPATPHVKIDMLSVALAAVAGFGLVFPLIEGRAHGWPAWSFALLALSGIAIAAFAVHQARRVRHGKAPLVEPSILRRRPYVAGLAVIVGFIGAMGGMILALNVMYQIGFGLSPLGCGAATVAIAVAAIPGSITSSVLLPKIGRTTMHLGLATMAVGLGVVAIVMGAEGGDLTPWELVAPLALTGFGMGQVFVPMFDVILAGVEPHQIGSASGLMESVQQLSMSLGIAVIGTILFDRLGSGHGPAAFVGAAERGLIVAIVFLAAAWLAVCWLPRHARGGH